MVIKAPPETQLQVSDPTEVSGGPPQSLPSSAEPLVTLLGSLGVPTHRVSPVLPFPQAFQVSVKSTQGPIDVFLCPEDSSGVCSPVKSPFKAPSEELSPGSSQPRASPLLHPAQDINMPLLPGEQGGRRGWGQCLGSAAQGQRPQHGSNPTSPGGEGAGLQAMLGLCFCCLLRVAWPPCSCFPDCPPAAMVCAVLSSAEAALEVCAKERSLVLSIPAPHEQFGPRCPDDLDVSKLFRSCHASFLGGGAEHCPEVLFRGVWWD